MLCGPKHASYASVGVQASDGGGGPAFSRAMCDPADMQNAGCVSGTSEEGAGWRSHGRSGRLAMALRLGHATEKQVLDDPPVGVGRLLAQSPGEGDSSAKGRTARRPRLEGQS